MNVEKKLNGNEAEIRIEGWIDTQAAPELADAIESLPEEITALTIDMEKTEYISSSGLRQIVAAHKRMHGNVTIMNVSVEVMDILRMTGFDKRLNIK